MDHQRNGLGGLCDNCARPIGAAEIIGNLRAEREHWKKKAENAAEEVRRLREHGPVARVAYEQGNTERHWQERLERYLSRDGGDPVPGLYLKIWKLQQREENMPPIINITHPSIRLVAPPSDEEEEEEDDDEERPRFASPLASLVLPQQFPPPVRVAGLLEWPGGQQKEVKFPFNRLPASIQQRIFKLWLCHHGRLVHAFSRLDLYTEPVSVIGEHLRGKRSGLPNRFYIGGLNDEINLTRHTIDPNEVLKVLLVCKRWYFIGVHCFYGMNTFSFSSIGEFGRFMKGIGNRGDRVQSVELTWVGTQYLTFKRALNKQELPGRTRLSRRTAPLFRLCEMPKLRYLVVHISESAKRDMRRKHEPKPFISHLESKTRGQPNYRKYRSLKCLQGLDAVEQLRGMKWIRWYDLYPTLTQKGLRQEVYDVSFVKHMMRSTSQAKTRKRKEAAETVNLSDLFPICGNRRGQDFVPSFGDWKMAKHFFNDEFKAFDSLVRANGERDAPLEAMDASVVDDASLADDGSHADANIPEEDVDTSDDEGNAPPRGSDAWRKRRRQEKRPVGPNNRHDSQEDHIPVHQGNHNNPVGGLRSLYYPARSADNDGAEGSGSRGNGVPGGGGGSREEDSNEESSDDEGYASSDVESNVDVTSIKDELDLDSDSGVEDLNITEFHELTPEPPQDRPPVPRFSELVNDIYTDIMNRPPGTERNAPSHPSASAGPALNFPRPAVRESSMFVTQRPGALDNLPSPTPEVERPGSYGSSLSMAIDLTDDDNLFGDDNLYKPAVPESSRKRPVPDGWLEGFRKALKTTVKTEATSSRSATPATGRSTSSLQAPILPSVATTIMPSIETPSVGPSPQIPSPRTETLGDETNAIRID